MVDTTTLTLLEHSSSRKAKEVELYQYRECGLENVWLVGGVSFVMKDGQECLQVDDPDELHVAIALSIIRRGDRITGRELRFLRHELGLTQADLARLLEADVQAVARWEKGRTKAPGPADRLIRFLYLSKLEKDHDVMQFLEELAALDRMVHGKQFFQRTTTGWQAAEAA